MSDRKIYTRYLRRSLRHFEATGRTRLAKWFRDLLEQESKKKKDE